MRHNVRKNILAFIITAYKDNRTTLAVGAAYLAKKKAIVQKLSAIESLAGESYPIKWVNIWILIGVDILCSDKTGTLTENKLSLHEPFVSEGVDPNWWLSTLTFHLLETDPGHKADVCCGPCILA